MKRLFVMALVVAMVLTVVVVPMAQASDGVPTQAGVAQGSHPPVVKAMWEQLDPKSYACIEDGDC
jgi:hypothetical protein